MTQQEFSKTKFGKGDKIIYHDQEYDVKSVEFEEMLFGIQYEGSEPGDPLNWVRCENVIFIQPNVIQI